MGYFFQHLTKHPAHPAILLYATARAWINRRLWERATSLNYIQVCGAYNLWAPNIAHLEILHFYSKTRNIPTHDNGGLRDGRVVKSDGSTCVSRKKYHVRGSSPLPKPPMLHVFMRVVGVRLAMGAEVRNHKQLCRRKYITFPIVSADGHTASNAPDLF